MPMPDDTKQPNSLMSGIGCYRKFLRDPAKRIRSLTSHLNRAPSSFLPPPCKPLCGSPWKGYQSLRSWCTLTRTPSLTTLALSSSTAMPARTVSELLLNKSKTTYPSVPSCSSTASTIESRRQWTPLDLEAASIVWSTKRLRGYI